MFFILSKFLSFLIHPFSWCILLLIATVIVKNSTFKKRLKLLALLIFILFSNTALFQLIGRTWENQYQRATLSPNNTYNIVVLGGYAGTEEESRKINFNGAADRLLQALPLYYLNPGNKLILSGGTSIIHYDATPESESVENYLQTIHIKKEDILVENQSRNTFENALYVGQLLDSLNISKDVVLVTSASHMNRALGCFKKQGINTITYPANHLTNSNPISFKDYIIPSLATLNTWPILIKEWIGIMTYKLKGFI